MTNKRKWSPAFNDAYWRGIRALIAIMADRVGVGRTLNVKRIEEQKETMILAAVFNVSQSSIARDTQEELLRQERSRVPTEVAQRIYRPDE